MQSTIAGIPKGGFFLKALIVGSGAREHAVAWQFSKSKRISGLFMLPGNAGTIDIAENIENIDILDRSAIITLCKDKKINLVFIGPEAPLAAGLADQLRSAGIRVIGPGQKASQLEASKTYSKQFMLKYGIPTAGAVEFHDKKEFEAYIKNGSGKRVCKKNGLAAGKGVLESEDTEELLAFGRKILKNDTLLVEEFLEGFEISIFTLFDGSHHLVFPPCADFKKAGENDTGPNTGGMGAICPVPGVKKETIDFIEEKILKPTFEGIRAEELEYQGFLYFGLMITEKGPKVLEYNVRLGDPEAQVLLPLIESDFGNLMEAVLEKKLDKFPLRIADKSAIGVVVASGGYPGSYKKGIIIEEVPENFNKKIFLFHASTRLNDRQKPVTGGGRCFTVVGVDKEILEARRIAYENASKVRFGGAWFRKDIGEKFLF
jgi:phosphoribosylamine---glycine ligase